MSRYTIKASQRLRTAQRIAHALAGLAVWLAEMPVAWAVALTALLLLSAGRSLRAQATLCLGCRDDGTLELDVAGQPEPYRLQAGSLVLPQLCVLQLQPESGGPFRRLVVLPDGLPADDFRRLRVWLKWRATTLA